MHKLPCVGPVALWGVGGKYRVVPSSSSFLLRDFLEERRVLSQALVLSPKPPVLLLSPVHFICVISFTGKLFRKGVKPQPGGDPAAA